jgi:two-component system, response regulator
MILLVEDNPDDEELTIDALRSGGVRSEIRVAHDGQEAIDALFAPGAQLPKLVLLDLKLPKLPGLEILRRMRGASHTRRIPTVILTSSSEHSDIHESYEAGANSYVRKPVDFDQFVDAVQRVGAYWVLVNEQPPEFV